MENQTVHIGKLLRQALRNRNMEVQAFAKHLGLHKNTAQRLFHKQTFPWERLWEFSLILNYDFLQFVLPESYRKGGWDGFRGTDKDGSKPPDKPLNKEMEIEMLRQELAEKELALKIATAKLEFAENVLSKIVHR